MAINVACIFFGQHQFDCILLAVGYQVYAHVYVGGWVGVFGMICCCQLMLLDRI